MSDGGVPHAAARFSAEVDAALTRARRAAREAKAESADFRRRTDELAGQARTGKLRGVRRSEVAPTPPDARADATKFRTDNGLAVPELPDADELIARLPNREPREPEAPPAQENDDFSQHQVMVDVNEQPESAADSAELPEPADLDSPEPARAPRGDDDEDFSQQRILLDATVESYRPDNLTNAVFEPSDPDNPR